MVRPASANPDSPLLPGATTTSSVGPAGDEMRTVVTTPTAGLLVRSTAYTPGWYADIQPASGAPGQPVASPHALGIVQAVRIPAGHFVVSWVYRPITARVGALSSFAATLVFVALLVLLSFAGPRICHVAFHRDVTVEIAAFRVPRSAAGDDGRP